MRGLGLILWSTSAFADTGCPEVEGELVEGFCVQELDCTLLDCGEWTAAGRPTANLESWRCSHAGTLGFYQVNDQSEWVTEHLYDRDGVLIGVRQTTLQGGPFCCEGQEVQGIGWGEIGGLCLAPVVEPGHNYVPAECDPQGVGGVESESGGCNTGVGPVGLCVVSVLIFLGLGGRRAA